MRESENFSASCNMGIRELLTGLRVQWDRVVKVPVMGLDIEKVPSEC